MGDDENQEGQVQFLLSDFNTRLRDVDERNRLIKERVLLLGQNLISSREELEEELKTIKKVNNSLSKDVEDLKKTTHLILEEIGKFVKREEIVVVERMLKDFQPLEFMRKKDVEELIEEKLGKSETSKQIKTTQSKK